MKIVFTLANALLSSIIVFHCQAQESSANRKFRSGTSFIQNTPLIQVKGILGKDTLISNGSGFFLNEKYIATCYHVYKRSSDFIPIEVKVLYNIRFINVEDYIYDSVYATLDYKTKRKQYDFKKHIFKNDFESDVVVLKLSDKIKAVLLPLDTSKVVVEDTFLSVGRTFDDYQLYGNRIIRASLESSIQTVVYVFPEKSASIYLTWGGIRPGYSGSPLYTNENRIIGMVQKCITNEKVENAVNEFLEKGILTKKQEELIMLVVRNNPWVQLGLSINSKYLFDKYLKRYF